MEGEAVAKKSGRQKVILFVFPAGSFPFPDGLVFFPRRPYFFCPTGRRLGWGLAGWLNLNRKSGPEGQNFYLNFRRHVLRLIAA